MSETPHKKLKISMKFDRDLEEKGKAQFTFNGLKFKCTYEDGIITYDIYYKGDHVDGGEYEGETFEAFHFMTYYTDHLKERSNENNNH